MTAETPSLNIGRDDLLRASDRWQVREARRARRPWRLLWLLAGPGLLVMLGENDGPSMVSYATSGAKYGIGFFVPFILLTFLMAYVVQEMAARVGMATQRGHSQLIFQRFGAFWGYFAMADLVFGNLLTLMTEFVAIQAGGRYFGVPAWVSVLFGIGMIGVALALRRYMTWERVLMGLALGNLFFVPAALYAHPDGAALARSVATWQPMPGIDSDFITLVLANIGATVTPWMIFFQQSAVVDKGLTGADLRQGRIDTALGAGLAAIAGIAALVAAAPLFGSGIDLNKLQDGADFATALQPMLGSAGSTLFALGMIEAGLLAAMTISASSSYAFAEIFETRHSFNLDFNNGRLFYAVTIVSSIIAGAVVLIPGTPLVALTLTVNVIATLLMAPALLFLLLLASDHEIMGPLVNTKFVNIIGGAIVGALAIVGGVYGVITIFPNLVGGNP
jgi:Mn2+/Fe2+ NRAMP family transporter